jgi:hypothetical protein
MSKLSSKLSKEDLIKILSHYYELDISNCTMSHEDWIKQLAEAMTNPDYLKNFLIVYEHYKGEINV